MDTHDHFHPSGYAVCTAPDIFDTESAADAIDCLDDLIRISPYVAVAMDGVELMTGAGVAVLLWACRRLESLGGQLVLVGVPQGAAATLAVSGARDRFVRVADLDDLLPRPGWSLGVDGAVQKVAS